ncbi:c-type cytochrome domain-containing protein [Pseudotenacibaculum haliotis]|uniref:C-type cytochrome domain-containing protein n=1 Tax=Pseudotenacibaculum haliotis TaxID=1862138 RepID=A0ABW5LR47_9FLAO
MKKYHFAILFAIGLTASSCTTAEIPLEEDPDPITQTVTYVGDVKAIIDNNCTTCHGTVNPNAGLSLVTYQQVRNSAENGNLIPRMNNATSPMPPSGILPAATRAIIDKWRQDGFLEN